MTYLTIGLILILSILLYFSLADRFNIIDKPNQRSSHTTITIRGGGIIFPIAVLLWFSIYSFPYPWFTAGLLLIAGISFLDDIYTLSTKPRLAVHLLSVALMLQELTIFSLAWYWWLVAFILIIGWINAYNFMDGINGISVLYALAVILPLWYVNISEAYVGESLIYILGISLMVFAFFNARKQAKTFAGDVGSVSLAFILAFLLLRLILQTGEWAFILLFGVYGIDTVLTIIHRLINKENIFKAHRSHLYQFLANEMKLPHLTVAAIYVVVQLIVSGLIIVVVNSGYYPGVVTMVVLIIMVVTYVSVKTYIYKKLNLPLIRKNI